MSKDKIIILILAFGILAALVAVVVVLRGGKDNAPQKTMYETSGQPVSVRDFTVNREPIPDKVSYLLADTGEYGIFYNGKTEEFQVSLQAQPVATVRKAAEQALLLELGITQEQACKLKIYVSGPISVDERFDGQLNVGLSFCKGSITL